MTPLELLIAMEHASPVWSLAFTHEGAPKSKARPRVVMRNGRSHTYTPEESEAAETALAWRWRMALKGSTHDGCLAIAMMFYRPNKQRIDTDNMIKLVLDAGTKARAWLDDSQIIAIVARTELDAARPRTEIALAPSTSTLERSSTKTLACELCKRAFTIPIGRADRNPPKFCGPTCQYAASREVAICTQCGEEFIRQRAGQSLCSHACRDLNLASESRRAIDAGKKPAPPTCEKCGGRVSRREYKQCAACLGRGRPTGTPNTEKP